MTAHASKADVSPNADEASLAAPSFAQERIWFLEQLYPNTPVYNMQVVLRLRSRLSVATLRTAMNDLVARHETLRTTFVSVDGRPQQLIRASLTIPLEHVDLRSLRGELRERRLSEIVAADAFLPFDLVTGPLLRAALVQLSDDDYCLLLCVHHIVADGWSVELLTSEIAEFYSARVEGRVFQLPPLLIQYADFAQWQRDRSTDSAASQALNYWREQLAGLPEVLSLPSDRPRPPVPSLRGAISSFVIEADLLEACKRLFQSSNTTLFTLLFSAFRVFLYRYSGQTDFAVGTPVANRARPELQNLIGLLVNILAIPCRMDPESTFDEHLAVTRRQMLDALTYQHVPFEEVVNALLPDRDLSVSPVFQTLFVLQSRSTAGERQVLEPSNFEDQSLGNGTAKFDLTLTIVEANRKLFCTWEYATDLFDTATVARMSEHFRNLLDDLVTQPKVQLNAANLISNEERDCAVNAWNRTSMQFPSDLGLYSYLSQRMNAVSDRIAVRHGFQEVSYDRLLQMASHVADKLRVLGVKPGDRVAVSLPRTPTLIASLLGILECGGAYVPLDTAYPRSRMLGILADSASVAFITARSIENFFGELNIPTLFLDHDLANQVLKPSSLQDAPIISRADSEAYVIYTSGSTGLPKGVRIAHSSAVSFADWVCQAYSVHEMASVLAATSICFDLSVFEIFGTLAHGGTIVLVENVLELGTLDYAVTLINTVPSAAQELLRLKAIPDSVKTINLAGEALSSALVQSLYKQSAVERVVNLYGPTEDTTYSTMAVIPREHRGTVPIGRPIANRRAYVLDSRLEPVPPGVVGEIYLGGAGVALGYNGRHELNTERFLSDPFVRGGRLFRTGDAARYRSDGALEYLGRKDGQVKVRGYRIELDEVRGAIETLPGVGQAHVALCHDERGFALAAYVVPEPIVTTIYPTDLARQLADTLPLYMTPTYWNVVQRIPLTSNGKVDHHALPTPKAGTAAPEEVHVQPRTATEQVLTEIWQNVLDLTSISIHWNFFSLGGHSLLLTKVAARVLERTGVSLPLRRYFEFPTIASFAIQLEAGSVTALTPSAEKATKLARPNLIPLSFPQERLWCLDQFNTVKELYTIPWSSTVRGQFNVEAFDIALNLLIKRHESLRTRFVAVDGVPTQVIEPAVDLAIDFYNIENLNVTERQSHLNNLARECVREAFDLAKWPLLRCKVARVLSHEHVVFFATHHIVSDGWSLEIFNRDLKELYQATLERRTAGLPDLAIQYADFALRQRTDSQAGDMSRHLAFWRDQLRAAPAVTTFPSDQPRPALQSHRGSSLFFHIDQATTLRINKLARLEGTSPFAVTLAVFQLLLAIYNGKEDVVTGTPVSGRHHPDVENLIGFFVNTLVIRTHVRFQSDFINLLSQVKLAVIDAFGHQDAPFERVVDALNPKRALSHSPIHQVMFGFQSSLTQRSLAAESTLAASPDSDASLPTTITSKFDLTFGLTEVSDGISGAVEYCTDLYDETTIVRIIANFKHLLDQVVENANVPLSQLSFVSSNEERLVRDAFPVSNLGDHSNEKLLDLFRRQVILQPDAAAIVRDGCIITFAEFDRWTSDVAAELQELGIGHVNRIGYIGESDLVNLIAMMASRKVGAVFVPLPRAAHGRHWKSILDNCRLSLVIIDTVDNDAPPEDLQILDIGTRQRGNRRETSVTCSTLDVACIFHTPAVHGCCRRVTLTERALVRQARAIHNQVWARYRGSRPVSILQLNSWDAGLEQIGAIAQGHSVHLVSYETASNVEVLAAYCARASIDVLDLRHSMLPKSRLVDQFQIGDYRPRACLISAIGWSDSHSNPIKWWADGDIYVCHSALEGTGIACIGSLRDRTTNGACGHPIGSSRLTIRDRTGNFVPIGVFGELCLEGDGLAVLDLPLTGSVLETSASAKSGMNKWARTGDHGRWLPSGEFEPLGDKGAIVSDYRFDPTVVSTVLMTAPNVREAVSFAYQEPGIGSRVIACVVPHQGSNITESELQALASQELPAYMVPYSVRTLTTIPRGINGEIDWDVLESDLQPQIEIDPTVRELRPMEKILQGIWSAVLGRKLVGIHDNFFSLGGHSLLAIQVISRVKEVGIAIMPRDIFELPTIAQLVQGLEDRERVPAAQPPQNAIDSTSQKKIGEIEAIKSLSETEVDELLRDLLREEPDQ